MRLPHAKVLEALIESGARPVREIPTQEGGGGLWAVVTPGLPPLVLELSGDGSDPTIILEEIERYRVLFDVYPPDPQHLELAVNPVLYSSLFLSRREARIMDRRVVDHEPGHAIWSQLACGSHLHASWITSTPDDDESSE